MSSQEPAPAGLRIAVVGGGCSGFSYSMAFENQPNMLDKTYKYDGLKVFVDQASLLYLDGAAGRLRGNPRGRGLQVQQPPGEIHLRLRQLLPGLSAHYRSWPGGGALRRLPLVCIGACARTLSSSSFPSSSSPPTPSRMPFAPASPISPARSPSTPKTSTPASPSASVSPTRSAPPAPSSSRSCSPSSTPSPRGQAKWTEPLTVTAAEKVSGTGIIASEISDGVQLPLRDVVNLMIVLSDNTATNMVLERFTADAVNAYLDKLGIKTTRSMRKIRGDGNRSRRARRLGRRQAPRKPEVRHRRLHPARHGHDPRETRTRRDRQPRSLQRDPRDPPPLSGRHRHPPPPRRREVANKTGALDALRSDVGIVYSPGGRIAMAITVDGIPKPDWTPDNPGLLMIADLAKLLVEGLGEALTDGTKPGPDV